MSDDAKTAERERHIEEQWKKIINLKWETIKQIEDPPSDLEGKWLIHISQQPQDIDTGWTLYRERLQKNTEGSRLEFEYQVRRTSLKSSDYDPFLISAHQLEAGYVPPPPESVTATLDAEHIQALLEKGSQIPLPPHETNFGRNTMDGAVYSFQLKKGILGVPSHHKVYWNSRIPGEWYAFETWLDELWGYLKWQLAAKINEDS